MQWEGIQWCLEGLLRECFHIVLSMIHRELLVQHSKVSGESLEMFLSGIKPALSTNSQQERGPLPLLFQSFFAEKTSQPRASLSHAPGTHADLPCY